MSKIEWNEIRKDQIIECTNLQQGSVSVIIVDDVTISDDKLEITVDKFMAMKLEHEDLANTSFELLSRVSLPHNYDKLKLTDYQDLKNGDEVYFFSDNGGWAYTNHFKSLSDNNNQHPFYFKNVNSSDISIYIG